MQSTVTESGDALEATGSAREALLERWSEAGDGVAVMELESPMRLGELAGQLASGLRPTQRRSPCAVIDSGG